MPVKPSRSRRAFRHRRLSSPRSIRILALMPSPEFQTALETALTEVSLDEVTKQGNSYEAVSYCWGSRFGTIPILCDSKQLLVTPNCESALRHLRLKDAIRVLWVDAICIDQENSAPSVKERNAQVALMGEIYRKAARTLCWFGPGNDYTGELMTHLERIGKCPSQRGLKKLLLFDEALRGEGRLDPDSSALNYIFCHPWHSRIWTVQEAAYSLDCLVVCGNSAIPWDIYSEAVHFLVFEQLIGQLDPQAHKSYIGIDIRNVVRDYLRGKPFPKPDPSPEDDEDERDQRVVFLSSCLSDIIQLQATEPRDKIYGLHALYTDLGIQMPAISYEKSIPRVYEEAAVAMITWSGTLKVLGDACHSHRDTLFPSWVPDWSDGNIKISIPLGDATSGSKITDSPETLNPRPRELHVQGKMAGTVIDWRHGRHMKAIFPTQIEQCELPISAKELDSLVEDAETLLLWINKTRFFRQLYSLLRNNVDYREGDLEDILVDLLYQDSFSEPDGPFKAWLEILKYPETKYALSHGERIVERWKVAHEGTTVHWTTEMTNCVIIMVSLLSNSIRHGGHVLTCTSEILDLINEFSGNMIDKALMLVQLNCSNKRAFGTGFHSVVAGDSVVLLKGAEWPVVLRQEGRKWRFICPTFVTGIMDGEAWVDTSGQVDKLTKFILV
ncbi:hypothetical protein CC78DRAFT_523119 [Lojkania enalia]|uniref:Heterokaryon incompatibility domain-containing protein n=1 Tax=Lojkania enalia TaxID=147567 RepID=A0A9P4K1R5_9PLEO|nr:hypothetical protein CC78DRAFT_523119 [Didymosphaeria enalia]